MIEQNIMAMTELAQHHGIKVVLCSVLPVSDYPFLRSQSARRPPLQARGAGRFRGQDDGQSSGGRHPETECLDEGLRSAQECGLRGLLHAARR